MSTLARIKALKPGMSASEKKIAEFVLASAPEIRNLNSQQLANRIGVSQSTIVKFCQKLGIQGYSKFKLDITAEIVHSTSTESEAVHGQVLLTDAPQDVGQKLIAGKIDALQHTIALNTAKKLNETVDKLLSADRILLSGVGASSLVIADLSYKLNKLGLHVIFGGDAHIQVANSASLSVGDLVLIVSFSGQSREVLLVAETAQVHGATVISITQAAENPLHKLSDLLLFSYADEQLVRTSSILARTSQLAVIDWLFLLLVQRLENRGELIRSAEESVKPLKIL